MNEWKKSLTTVLANIDITEVTELDQMWLSWNWTFDLTCLSDAVNVLTLHQQIFAALSRSYMYLIVQLVNHLLNAAKAITQVGGIHLIPLNCVIANTSCLKSVNVIPG